MTALDKFKAALDRVDYFGGVSDDANFVIEEDNCMTELLDKSEGLGDDLTGAKSLTLGDLRQLLREIG